MKDSLLALKFRQWLRLPSTRRGAKRIYYTGHIGTDRGDDSAPRSQNDAQKAVSVLATTAFEAHQRGEVSLTQTRIGPATWAYLATRK